MSVFILLSTLLAAEGSVERIEDATLRFPSGSAAVSATHRAHLTELVKRLRDEPRDLLVVGHSDRTGGGVLNQDLSRQRAGAVARALIAAGWPASRLERLGLGFAEPLDRGKNPEAHALNRRVEIWLVARNQVGWVSWRRRRLEARKEATEWFDAPVSLPLERRDRVRTRANSAGEITFRKGHILYLGPNGSLVVYGGRASRRQRAGLEDVRLEQGSLLASLPATVNERLSVATSAGAKVRGVPRGVRIESGTDGRSSLISVYDGRLTVAARGRTVKVRSGFGTRVRKGRRPERPTRLPPPPKWSTSRPWVAPRDVEVAWTSPPRGTATQVEVSDGRDSEFRRILTSTVAQGRFARIVGLPPGRYLVRLRARDAKGLVGPPSSSRVVRILGDPEGPVAGVDGDLTLPGPGLVIAPQPSRLKTWFERGTSTATVVQLSRPGPHRISWVAATETGQVLGRFPVAVEVQPLSATINESGVEIRDANGVPRPGLSLGLAPAASTACGEAEALTSCVSTDASMALLEDQGDGSYVWPPGSPPPEGGRFIVGDALLGLGRAVRFEPVQDDVPPEPAPIPPVGYLGFAGGFEARDIDAASPFGTAELGIEVSAGSALDLRAGIEVGFARFDHEVDGGILELTEVPVSAQLDLIAPGTLRPWIGFGFGTRLLGGQGAQAAGLVEVSPFVKLDVGLGVRVAAGLEAFVTVATSPGVLGGAGLEGWLGLPSLAVGMRTTRD